MHQSAIELPVKSGIFVGTCLASWRGMPILKKSALEAYLKDRFGPTTTLVTYGPIGKETTGPRYKQYGYGAPVRLTFRAEGRVRRAVLGTMSPGPFGHEHPADRAQAMLWDYDCYGRLPRHIAALDVGAFTEHGELMSVAAAREFFLLTQWSDGVTYNKDLERLARAAGPTLLDRKRAEALADYLVSIHGVKHRDPQLYRRRLRELLGHGECIMGLTDSYPDRFAFISDDLLQTIETACNEWRWRLRGKHARLSQVHGDFHPWNVLFRRGADFSVLDRSRGEWGEPADDVTSMSINYLFFSLCRHGTLKGPFEVLFRSFWDRYLTRSRDQGVLDATAPFFAFRGLVLASPLWYPKLTVAVRRKIFRFIENVLAVGRFDPAEVNRYCR
jgi:hypothetical protein